MGLEQFWIGKIEINEYTIAILAIVAFAIAAGFRYRRNLYLEDLRIPELCDRSNNLHVYFLEFCRRT